MASYTCIIALLEIDGPFDSPISAEKESKGRVLSLFPAGNNRQTEDGLANRFSKNVAQKQKSKETNCRLIDNFYVKK